MHMVITVKGVYGKSLSSRLGKNNFCNETNDTSNKSSIAQLSYLTHTQKNCNLKVASYRCHKELKTLSTHVKHQQNMLFWSRRYGALLMPDGYFFVNFVILTKLRK